MSLYSASEAVLQAVVEILLPSKHRVPELCLVMDGKKQKGSGHFGYLDLFILGGARGNNICIELKYISLTGLVKDKSFNANELEKLDKILEKEDEGLLLERQYKYRLKELNKWDQKTIYTILNDGIKQLNSYMSIIAKGQAVDYSSSGVYDERIKITKSEPNQLKGFIIIVVGFRRILWRPVEEITSNY